MKLIERSSVYIKTLILLTGFCALMMRGSERAMAQFPSASFSSNVFAGCAPLSVDFINYSSQANDYFWDFGNGNTSTLADPTTVYLASGYYTVVLVAIDTISGNTDTLVATNYIHVVDNPVADFSATTLSGCEGHNSISFTNASTNASGFIWDFGDGTFSTLTNPVHSYTNSGVYTVKLIASNGYGCNNIKIRNSYITITTNPPAAMSVNQQSSCDASDVFNFTCTTPGGLGWLWNFGDGATSNAQNPSHVYGVSGSFNVSLIVYNANGCSDTVVNNSYINIGPNLVPTFTVTSQAGCLPFSTTFNCSVANATSWLWDFGDGATSILENPSHTYAAAGSYNITLTVTTSVGCNGTVSLPGYITVDALPIPAFVVNDPSGCSPHTTFFTNNSANAATYLWDFGNGVTSTDPNPFNTYPDSGTYTVTLTATSPNGCQATITQPAAVMVEILTAGITATPRTGCAPLTVAFTGTATPAGSVWNWTFGDGNTGTGQNISHTYAALGSYLVSLVVTSPQGCIDTITRNNYIRVVSGITSYTVPDTIQICTPPGTASFTDPTTGSNSWAWNFGDGSTATVKNPTHIYTVPGVYTVTLTTGMAGGCSQTFNPFAIVNVIPFVTTPILSVVASPCAPYLVQFDNLSLNIASYLWNFGDGDTSVLQNPVHVYAQAGIYTVTLLLTGINGCQTTLTTTITFGYQNVIGVSDTTNCLGDPINFTLNPSAAFVSATWNFGNGVTSNLLQPVYTYPDTGVFYVSVVVTDTGGCVFNYSYQNAIYVSDPLASFTINQPVSGCVPYDVQFINNSTNATSYYWNFGDGTNGSQANPLHTYTTAGTYTVSLNANKRGCRNTMTLTNYITVNEATANFSFTPDSGCIPLTATFTDLSLNPVSWQWDFGDGTTSLLQNPVHNYTTEPAGLISLIMTDVNGCVDTMTAANVVGIFPDITISANDVCRLEPVNFSTLLNATSYLWDFGDGTTSSLQNPTHQYSQNGSFNISLSCMTTAGCNAIAYYPTPITVSSPTSAFMSPTVAVCAPSLVTFVNQSTGATSWLWDFGDGTTATAENPAHIYNIPGTYSVSLISYSDSGCTDTLVLVDYIIVPGTVSDFTASATDACENSIVHFTDLSLNADIWFWNFGDGFTDSIQNPDHIYADSGSYTVTLITTDSIGCTSFYTLPTPIIIHPNPDAQASVVPTGGCMPLLTTFTNLSTGTATYTWYFDDGTSAVAFDTTHIYTSAGIYYPTLIATTSFGCVDTFVFFAGVNVFGLPVPSFTANYTSACVPATVTFTNTSTNLLNPTFQWDFGNGQVSNVQDPVITFNIPGTYPVQLIVTNTGGCQDTIIQNITISNNTVATASPSGNAGCAPYLVNFTNSSSNATSYLWDFGNGSTDTSASPSYTYTTSGSYTVTLVAINSGGCSDTLIFATPIQVFQTPVANFNRSPVVGCSPMSVIFTDASTQLNNPVYDWNYGNGQNGNQPVDTILYNTPGTIPVTLIVTNSNGCSDTISQNVIVNQTPVANGSISSYNGCAPFAVNFTNNSTNGTSYIWNFGDGTTSTLTSPSHSYLVAGDYTVTLIANTASGCADTMVFNTNIHAGTTPDAVISLSDLNGCLPLSVNFSSQSTGLLNPVYQWNLGNGQTSSLSSGSTTYNTAGSFPITLIVTNQGGCADSTSASVDVFQTPQAIANTTDTAGCAPYQVTFNNTSLFATTYKWDFGDGTTSVQQAPVHTYTLPGTYQVMLITTGTGGCIDSLTFPYFIHVKAMPSAAFIPSTLSGCTPLNVNFNNTSTGLSNATYQWNFGNATTDTVEEPSITYTQGGAFNVSLLVTNDEGCQDSVSVLITSNLSPVAQAAPIDTSGCVPHPVNFMNTSLFADNVSWNFGNSNGSTADTVQYIYNTPGTYQPILIATTNAGCSDTLVLSSPVHVYSNPVAAFTISQNAGCSGTQFVFTNYSSPGTGVTYQWNIAGNSYTTVNPVVTITTPGFHDIQLIVTSQFGCTDTLVQQAMVQVFDTVPPAASPILSVSVKNDSMVEINWMNNSALDLGAYILYRFNAATNIFDEIYRDTTPNNSSMNVTSMYEDRGLNTLQKTYTYKLQTIDQCSQSLPMSALTAHTTINVTAVPVGSTINVSWTGYLGCAVTNYEVNRVDLASGISSLIATVPPTVLTYIDQGFTCPELYSYRIRATSLCGNNYFSLSDTSSARTYSPLAGQKVEVVRSTVINDHDVLTEWLPPVLAPSRVVEYKILKSTDNIHFTEIASLTPNDLSYIDYNAYVHEEAYFYRIDVVNDCMITGTASDPGSSILLKSGWEDEAAKLWWTPYIDWDSGVDYYVIEKEESSGQWRVVKTVDGNVVNTIVDE